MTRIFLHIFDWLSNRRWLPLTMLIAMLTGAIWMASTLVYQEDISAFLPISSDTRDYMEVYSSLNRQNRIAVVINGETDSVVSAMDEYEDVANRLDTEHIIKNLQATIEEDKMLEVVECVSKIYPLLLSSNDLQHIDSMLIEDGYVHEQMVGNHEQLMLPTSSFMTQNLPYDPLHFSGSVMKELQEMGKNNQFHVVDGHLFSHDDRRGIILLDSPYGMTESAGNAGLDALLTQIADTLKAAHPTIDIASVGAPVIAVTNANQIKRDSVLAVGLSIALILAILLYVFRRVSDIAWIALSISFGWLFALGCIAILKDNISIIVLGIGSIIIGVAANYPLHFMDHLQHEPSRRATLREMVPPLLIGNITTVSAFACLWFLDAEAMRDLGIFGSLMLVGTILCVLILLPHLVSSKPRRTISISALLPSVHIPTSLKRYSSALVVVLTTVFGYFSLDTTFDANMHNINYMTDSQREGMELLASNMEGSDSLQQVFVVARGSNMEEALVNNEAVTKLMEDEEQILQITGIGHFVPSKATRKKRLDDWRELIERHPELETTITQEGAAQGFRDDAFAPFFALKDIDIEDDAVFEPIMDQYASNFVTQSADSTLRIVNIAYVNSRYAADVVASLRSKLGSEAFAFSVADVSNVLTQSLSDSFNYIGIFCGCVVFFFLWLSFGRLELSLLSFLPLAVAWVWILGIMGIFDIRFNIVNIILATFIFGQGDDYTIFITEGLMYEYAYGKKRLETYKNSVALSAILMFVGIGSLIVARHPAMRSLAEVTIIGMIVVVIMAFYLPPLVFRWITTKHGAIREVPLTLSRFFGSLYAMMALIVAAFGIFLPITVVYRLFFRRTEKWQLAYHRLLQLAAKFVIYRVPGMKYRYVNEVGEDFGRPSVIICNHQSHLDVMCILMMSPKIVILTNDWVWNSPLYGFIIHAAEFCPVSDGMDKNLPRLQNLVQRGYSVVVFPEGTRTPTREILRFHKGAFTLAKMLNVDILPLFLHGLADILPKRDFLLRRGHATLEVRERMKAEELQKYSDRELTRIWHQYYVDEYDKMSRRIEDAEYFADYVNYKYLYKGFGIERNCKKILRKLRISQNAINDAVGDAESVALINSGQGEFAWIAALTHRDTQIFAFEIDEELHSIAINTQGIPSNLHFVCSEYPTESQGFTKIIDVKKVTDSL